MEVGFNIKVLVIDICCLWPRNDNCKIAAESMVSRLGLQSIVKTLPSVKYRY